jgi:hypothetical protein
MITKTYLSKVKEASFRVQPVGLINDYKYDLWVHVNFEFDAKRTEVVVESWFVTNSTGEDINLSALNYYQFQTVAQALTEEYESHVSEYYDELESEHYSGPSVDRMEDVG